VFKEATYPLKRSVEKDMAAQNLRKIHKARNLFFLSHGVQRRQHLLLTINK
jgi:hypothetical protein